MPTMNDAFPSDYLKADDAVDADLLLTITDVRKKTIGQGRQADEKFVAYFRETEKGLVLNKTNWTSISKLNGSDDCDDWEGQRIALFATEVTGPDGLCMGLRVRTKAPKANGKPGKPAPVAANQPTDEDGVPVGDDGKPIF